jgi:hypothetical protein
LFEVERYNIRPQRTARVGGTPSNGELASTFSLAVPYKSPCTVQLFLSVPSAYLRQSPVRWEFEYLSCLRWTDEDVYLLIRISRGGGSPFPRHLSTDHEITKIIVIQRRARGDPSNLLFFIYSVLAAGLLGRILGSASYRIEASRLE